MKPPEDVSRMLFIILFGNNYVIRYFLFIIWLGFMIYYKEESKPSWLEKEMLKPRVEQDEDITYRLSDLKKGTVYHVYMRSVGEKSLLSEKSEALTVRTEGECMFYCFDICPFVMFVCFGL